MANVFTPNIGADLERIHRVITRGLDVAIDNCPRLQTDLEGPLREGFLNYILALATVLDGHHITEDELVFPFFSNRLPALPCDHLSLQHQEMLGNVQEIFTALTHLREGMHIAAATERLHEALRRLDATWLFHIETEESHLTPVNVEDVATLDEQIALRVRIGELNQQHLQPPMLCIPFVLYNLDVEDRAVLASVMPLQITQELVPGPWLAHWATMRPFLLE